ncbi:MAG: hypothetical protein KA533_09530 [Sphingobium sp.]|nr:hypothetical protein [Sphingobium sp.]MBP6111958.1 hypothetical protein [Sphingobium sp.]MBP8671056.1 hypothetical protein [Sphingobium sp.]MBP9158737.1 hypothetical protein [Sphingobium sp.]MCC6481111.1 hypothetical protein [Sphingomonadaceae bacterium]
MDALLLSLILCALAEAGRRANPQSRLDAAPLILACAANALLAAVAGAWIMPMLTPEARTLFLAVALAIAGLSLVFAALRPGKQGVAHAAQHSSGMPLFSSFVRHLIRGMNGSAPLLIAACTVSYVDPWMAGIGGALGCIAAGFMPLNMATFMGAGALRYGGGGLMLGASFPLTVAALRLV